jgi:ankyrin repeat protein
MVPSPSNDALIAAVRGRDAAEVERLIASGAHVNSRDPTSRLTGLMFAAGVGDTKICRSLIFAGALVNAVDDAAGATALHKACQGGNLEAVQVLVEAGAFVNQQTTTTGHTPLVEAIWFKSDAIVRYLLDHGARTNIDTYYAFTIDDHINYALRVNEGAAGHDALLRIQAMVAERKEALSRQQGGQNLNAAILKGDLAAVRTALKAGEDIEQRYPAMGTFQDGHTPLLIAARDGHTEIVSELIRHGANVNAVESVFGAVPLHKATYHGYLETTKLLAHAPGINLDYQGPSNGYTPLHDALWHAYPECAKALLDAGARTDLVAWDGKLPLDIAVQELGPDHPIVSELRRAAGERHA